METELTPDELQIHSGFAQTMLENLRENVHKGGWDESSPWYLFNNMEMKVDELAKEILLDGPSEAVRREAANVANFAMMIADVYERRKARSSADGADVW